jgi:hypothetical protein
VMRRMQERFSPFHLLCTGILVIMPTKAAAISPLLFVRGKREKGGVRRIQEGCMDYLETRRRLN